MQNGERRIVKISEGFTSTPNPAGSQTKDDNKGISSIAYNVLGKPLTVNFTSGKKVEYIYDASGGKRKSLPRRFCRGESLPGRDPGDDHGLLRGICI